MTIDHDLGPRSNITQLAHVLNMNRAEAKRILEIAKIKRDARAREYPTEIALAALVAFTDSSKASGQQLNGMGSGYENSNLNALADARASAEKARARKVILEVEQKEGRLVSKQAVVTAATDFATHLRNGLLGLGARICTKCVGRDADEISDIIETAIADALADLSDADSYLLTEAAR
jgi:hypothetical protein